MLSRFFFFVTFVLTILCGVALFVYAGKYPDGPVEPDSPYERISDISSKILSTFSLFPDIGTEKSFFAVMIENHEDARPYHTGLQDAVMVQEFLVEGFISRFVALFDARRMPKEVGPVRSLRPYFLDAVAPWTRTIFHAGGSPEALKRVMEGSTFFARNLLYYDDEYGSLRKEGPLPPHDLFLSRALLKEFLAEVPESLHLNAEWPPFPTGLPEGGAPAQNIRVNFFSTLHNVVFEFLPLSQKYKRINGQEVSPAQPSTVVILEVPIDNIGEYGRLFMTLEGSGKVQVFHSGKVWEGKWSRTNFKNPFQFTDAEGNDIALAKGQVWMMVLPTLERVRWE